MPSLKVKLGHDQKFKLDGVAMDGTRDVDVTLESRQLDVTHCRGTWVSTLPLAMDVTLRVLLYWQENFDTIFAKFNQYPPQKVDLEIDGVLNGPFVPVECRIANPMANVTAWDVTFKLWCYD